MGTFYALNAVALQAKSALRLVPGTIAFFGFHFFFLNLDLYYCGRMNGVSFICVLLLSCWGVGCYFVGQAELGALKSGLVLPWLKKPGVQAMDEHTEPVKVAGFTESSWQYGL